MPSQCISIKTPILRIIFLFLGLFFLQTSISAQCNLVCHNKVNASMPAFACTRFFEPADLLQNIGQCDPSNYSVKINHPFGTHKLANDQVDRSHLGYNMVFQVTDSTTGSSCWGYLIVEDKSAPDGGCVNQTISCYEVAALNALLNQVVDNCSAQTKAAIERLTYVDLGCDDTLGIGIVYRVIRTSDTWGNSSTCNDTLIIRRDSLDDINCTEIIELNCRSVCYKVNANGSVQDTTTTIIFSSKKTDPNYPSPQFLLDMQNANKWRNGENPELSCLPSELNVVPELCLPITSNALNFDGEDDYLEAEVDVSEDGFTAELWFRTINGNCGIFSATAGSIGGPSDRHIYLSGGNLSARVYNGDPGITEIASTGINYADGQWHHVAYVLGNSINGNRLYADGVLVASASKTFSDFYWQDRVTIGYSSDAANRFFTGDIDEVRIWNTARSQSQIQSNRFTELLPQPTLQVYYQLNQGTAGGNNAGIDVAEDNSGHGNNANLNSFALAGATSNWVTGQTLLTNCIPVYPAIGGFCKTTVTYKDEILPICQGDGSFKIRREWLIVDWCSGEERTCVQYISVKDLDAPLLVMDNGGNDARDDRRRYVVFTNPHDCYASVNLKELVIDDCSRVQQTYSLSYEDISHPAKIITLTGSLPTKINLPPLPGIYGRRTFVIDVSLVDACYNRSATTIEVSAIDETPPNPVCDENTQVTLDPATCWARVYAKDLDNGSRDNCCDVLHFAIARMDSVEAARKYVIAEVIAQCGQADYLETKDFYDFYAEDYISSYIFKDYLDLSTCGSTQLILRVWEACGVPRFDPHIWPCSEHQWFMYNIGYPRSHFRADHNLNFGFSQNAEYSRFTAPKDCNWRYPLIFCDPQLAAWFPLAGIDDNNPYYEGSAAAEVCDFDYYWPRLENLTSGNRSGGYAPGNTCSRFLYSDCMINIIVDDKTPAVCESPIDLHWYCDDAGGVQPSAKFQQASLLCTDFFSSEERPFSFDDYTCTGRDDLPYFAIECDKENDGISTDAFDPTGKAFGWYGCNIYGNTHQSEHGDPLEECRTSRYHPVIAGVEGAENNIGSSDHPYYDTWIPAYCHNWLCADKYDQPGKIDPKTKFYTPVFRVGGRGENSAPGTFIVWDNCILPQATTKDEQYIDQCGKGWLKRTWTITTNCENTPVTCSQKIYTYHRSDFETIFPTDLLVTCNSVESLSPDVTGRPLISDDECELVAVNYTDQRFDIVPDACYKIVRTWTLIDWCIYDANNANNPDRYPEVIVDDRLVADTLNRFCVYRNLKDDGDGIMTYTQVIKVIDQEAPQAEVIRDTTFCILDGYNGTGAETDPMCQAGSYRSPDFTGTDNCTASDLLRFRWELDKNPVSASYRKSDIDVLSAANVKNFVSSELTSGTHRIYVIVSDNCGNEDTTSYLVTVKDCKKPTPYCFNGIATVIMPSTGTITVWAQDLNAGSYDNCTKKTDLKYSFDAAGLEQSRTYNCDSVPNGIGATKAVSIYVWDQAGNKDFCETYLLIQDGSGNACTDIGGLEASISGLITTERKDPIELVVMKNSTQNKPMPSIMTSENGSYSFSSLPMKSNYKIQPQRNDNPVNGVTTLDLVMIQKHILGVELLSSPYAMIAADADHNNEINSLDLVALRKLILTVYDVLPENQSWRFIPKSHAFADPSNPWAPGTTSTAFPETIEIASLNQDELNRDFIGIKVGDVNASVVPHRLLGAEVRENRNDLKIFTSDLSLKAGELATIDFYAANFNQIEGYQFTLAMPGLELKGFNKGALNLNENNFGFHRLKEGYLTTSWNENHPMTLKPNEVLFSLNVRATKAVRLSQILSINSRYTHSEAYQNDKSLGVSLNIGQAAKGNYALHQNVPNPFKVQTIIGFELAQSETVSLQITDVTGKLVLVNQLQGVQGYNQWKLDQSKNLHAGVYYYTLETKHFKATRKLIVVE